MDIKNREDHITEYHLWDNDLIDDKKKVTPCAIKELNLTKPTSLVFTKLDKSEDIMICDTRYNNIFHFMGYEIENDML